MLTVKTDLVTKRIHVPRVWNDFWYNLSSEIERNLVHGTYGTCTGQGQLQH
jgi:hypothetical protein